MKILKNPLQKLILLSKNRFDYIVRLLVWAVDGGAKVLQHCVCVFFKRSIDDFFFFIPAITFDHWSFLRLVTLYIKLLEADRDTYKTKKIYLSQYIFNCVCTSISS